MTVSSEMPKQYVDAWRQPGRRVPCRGESGSSPWTHPPGKI